VGGGLRQYNLLATIFAAIADGRQLLTSTEVVA